MSEELRRIGKQLWEGLVPQFPNLTPEQMTPEAIADIISGYIIGNPNAPINRSMAPEARIFTIDTVLQNAGHIPTLTGTDMMQKFPREYRAARAALHELVKQEILTTHELENGIEKTGYSVADLEKLHNFVSTRK